MYILKAIYFHTEKKYDREVLSCRRRFGVRKFWAQYIFQKQKIILVKDNRYDVEIILARDRFLTGLCRLAVRYVHVEIISTRENLDCTSTWSGTRKRSLRDVFASSHLLAETTTAQDSFNQINKWIIISIVKNYRCFVLTVATEHRTYVSSPTLGGSLRTWSRRDAHKTVAYLNRP